MFEKKLRPRFVSHHQRDICNTVNIIWKSVDKIVLNSEQLQEKYFQPMESIQATDGRRRTSMQDDGQMQNLLW